MLVVLAGEEGFEPSAYGFGDALRITYSVYFQKTVYYQWFALLL